MGCCPKDTMKSSFALAWDIVKHSIRQSRHIPYRSSVDAGSSAIHRLYLVKSRLYADLMLLLVDLFLRGEFWDALLELVVQSLYLSSNDWNDKLECLRRGMPFIHQIRALMHGYAARRSTHLRYWWTRWLMVRRTWKSRDAWLHKPHIQQFAGFGPKPSSWSLRAIVIDCCCRDYHCMDVESNTRLS